MGPLFLADDVAAVANAMCRHDMALKTFFAQGDVLAMECTIQVCIYHILLSIPIFPCYRV